jgi:exo-beta-1,3-glucanase (GH17 family)
MFPYAKAVCYSGYRQGQSPITKVYPSDGEVLEDLRILEPHFEYLRMYDPYHHAQSVLRVIKKHQLKFKVMLGVEPGGEISNPNCPWGGLKTPEQIERNRVQNYGQLDMIAALANEYPDQVLAVSVGNENTSSWHHNLMDPHTIAKHVTYLKALVKQPVTFCEGAHAWREHGESIAKEVDFISIHSYPLWLRIPLDQAVKATISDYDQTVKKYPKKPVIFTEFGWTTTSDDKMRTGDACELNQHLYLTQIEKWSQSKQVTMFLFEAFDEPWKGSSSLIEPEKHWGVFFENRQPKLHYYKLIHGDTNG